MNFRFIFQLTVVLIVGVEAIGAETSSVTKAAAWFDYLQKYLPGEQAQCGATAVSKLVGLDAYAGRDRTVEDDNTGIEGGYAKLLVTNKCFAAKFGPFWLAHDATISNASSLIADAKDRPNITEEFGRGRFSNLSPGQLWNDAMKAMNGNPNLAMALLGACTNDDHAVSYRVPVANEVLQIKVPAQRETMQLQIESLRKSLAGVNSNSDQFALTQIKIKSLSNTLDELESYAKNKGPVSHIPIRCPEGDSKVFVQRAVDASFTLDPKLKTEIIRSQRPNGGTDTLASKAYHFVGGALIGCELAKCGIAPENAQTAAKYLAMMYRGIRLCPIIKRQLTQRDAILKKYDLEADDPSFPAKAFQYLKQTPAKTFTLQGVVIGELSDARAKNQISEMEAATLYSKWYLGGPDGKIPCTGIRGGPPDLLADDHTNDRTPLGSLPSGGSICQIPGWNPARCSSARKKLATWDVDFRWTEAQHETGARFGAQQCKPDSSQALAQHQCSISESDNPNSAVDQNTTVK